MPKSLSTRRTFLTQGGAVTVAGLLPPLWLHHHDKGHHGHGKHGPHGHADRRRPFDGEFAGGVASGGVTQADFDRHGCRLVSANRDT